MAREFDTCSECGAGLVHPPGRGKARKYCSDDCQKNAMAKRLIGRQLEPCRIAGCRNPANRTGLRLCEKHYMRIRRNGTAEYIGGAIPGNLIHSAGCVRQPALGHPRALGGYRAYQHRVVFTDRHGEGPFSCHWCGVEVCWDDMHVDHLDDDRQNNLASNLVASCPKCNQKRGRWKMVKAMRLRGRILTAHGLTMCMSDWARHLGITWATISFRLKKKWPIEEALTPKRYNTGPKRVAKPEHVDLTIYGACS